MILKFITFDIENRTIEATWFDEETRQPVRCHNYSEAQKADFLIDVEGGSVYTDVLEWQDAPIPDTPPAVAE